MTLYEVAKQVMAPHQGCHVIRPRKNQTPDTPVQYDARPHPGQGKTRGWTLLDSFTGSAVVAVREALSEQAQQKFDSLPLLKAVNVTWKLIEKYGKVGSK